MFTYTIKRARKIRKFHEAVVQRRLRIVQKSVRHVQSCCFAKINLLLFCCFLCCRCLLLWSRNFATMVMWRHTSPHYSSGDERGETAVFAGYAGADLGGGCRGCPPPSEMTCGFLIQLVFCKKKAMWFFGVEVEQETSAPPPKKYPGSAPVGWVFQCNTNTCHARSLKVYSLYGQTKSIFLIYNRKHFLRPTTPENNNPHKM